MRPRPILLSLALVFVTALIGFGARFAPLGLPHFIVKYGGSTMWALMFYWIASTLLPTWRVPAVAALTGVSATAVELLKLCHSPGLDAFRGTFLGIVLLGRYFSAWDIVAYWVAIACGAYVDRAMLRAGGESRR